MIVFDGYIGAPPTSTVISAKAGAKDEESTAPPSAAKLIVAAKAAVRNDGMKRLLLNYCRRAAGNNETPRVAPGLVSGNYGRAAEKVAGMGCGKLFLADF